MLEFNRLLSTDKISPYSTVKWVQTDIKIPTEDGSKIIYECLKAEFPETWSDLAKRTVASKYFRESMISENRETSAKDMIERVVIAITDSGKEQKYFDDSNASIFADELRSILLNQTAAFNSPVWFNLGVPGVTNPQISACFINEVEDNMESILELAKTEGLIFKSGSGSGVNFSALRGSNERIRGGGTASGPVSFLRGYDAFAGVILSGGRTRRAARMCILDVDHPDIRKFISLKPEQEDIAAILVEAGYSTEFNALTNNAYDVVRHQSGNNSVRVTDDFMKKVKAIVHGYEPDALWQLNNRADPILGEKVSIKELFKNMADAAWKCGDPGLQFDGATNKMNTCIIDGKIISSNPCAEFVWLSNSSCNLASINLDKFVKEDRTFDINTFRHVVRTLIIAQDILIDLGGYPTEKIRANSHAYRPLGLGYTNLGSILMSWGLPYDSTQGRNLAAAITSLMTAQAYLTSTELAGNKGAFEAFDRNKSCMEDVLDTHYAETKKLEKDIAGISVKAQSTWQEVMAGGFGRRRKPEETYGFRNAQVTLLAPTGTISWLMDAATTGIEPDIALRKTKYLVGGNKITYVNPNIEKALKHLGYDDTARKTLLDYVQANGHLEGSILQPQHLAVFDCALPVPGQSRSISADGHIQMMAAVQPFLSGAISKTVNLPNNATPTDIGHIFIKAWESKLKSIAIYRNGSKMSEPLRVREIKEKKIIRNVPQRKILPADLIQDKRHAFSVGGHKGYVHVGLDDDTRQPIEIFVRMAKFGNTVGGLLDNYGILFSKALQYGIPLEELISHMEGSKFPPAGFTSSPKIRSAGSILDYLAQYIRLKYITEEYDREPTNDMTSLPSHDLELDDDINGEICPNCGALMRKSGTCSFCTNCPFTSGVCG
jgi:ribonucleoside-diphosphate reductase alpha chain